MKCPHDNTTLVMADRQGIEIDYCPDCRGVWLDRGELDKIIERSQALTAPRSDSAYDERVQPQHDYRREERRRDDDRSYKKRKKESFLGDLFDF